MENDEMAANVLMLAVMVLAGGGVSYQDAGEVPEVLRDANKKWMGSWQGPIDQQMEFLTVSYELNVDLRESLLQELMLRLELQATFEERAYAKLDELLEAAEAAGGGEDSEAMKQATDHLWWIADTMPLNEERVAQWLEERLPPKVVATGRPRWEELRYRRNVRQSAGNDDSRRRSSVKRSAIRGRRARMAQHTPSGSPLPRGDKAQGVKGRAQRVAARRFIRPSEVIEGRRTGSWGGDEGAAPAAMGVRVGVEMTPPLDEWDKHVASVAESHKMTEAQVTTARSILRGLRHRAYEYHRSRLAEYERVALIEERHVRQAQEEALNRPLDAMFEELKARLECLLTIEQKKQASAAE